jgi:cytochrome c-type biogenesis protein
MAFFAGLVLSLTALGALAGVLGFVATQAIGQWWMLIMAALAFVAALAVLAGPSVRLPDVTAPAAARASWCLRLWIRLQSRHAGGLPAPGAHRRRGRTPSRPMALLLALGYGVGRGLPFLLLGLCSGAAMRLRCQPSWSRAVQVTTGSLLLVITGYYLWIFLRLS